VYILAVTLFSKGRLKVIGYKKKTRRREEVEDF